MDDASTAPSPVDASSNRGPSSSASAVWASNISPSASEVSGARVSIDGASFAPLAPSAGCTLASESTERPPSLTASSSLDPHAIATAALMREPTAMRAHALRCLDRLAVVMALFVDCRACAGLPQFGRLGSTGSRVNERGPASNDLPSSRESSCTKARARRRGPRGSGGFEPLRPIREEDRGRATVLERHRSSWRRVDDFPHSLLIPREGPTRRLHIDGEMKLSVGRRECAAPCQPALQIFVCRSIPASSHGMYSAAPASEMGMSHTPSVRVLAPDLGSLCDLGTGARRLLPRRHPGIVAEPWRTGICPPRSSASTD